MAKLSAQVPAIDRLALAEARQMVMCVTYVGISVGAGIGAAALGVALAYKGAWVGLRGAPSPRAHSRGATP